jgi:hypothetical protein
VFVPFYRRNAVHPKNRSGVIPLVSSLHTSPKVINVR